MIDMIDGMDEEEGWTVPEQRIRRAFTTIRHNIDLTDISVEDQRKVLDLMKEMRALALPGKPCWSCGGDNKNRVTGEHNCPQCEPDDLDAETSDSEKG